MRAELDDFLHYCHVERRLAPLTCAAYERDVRACLTFLQRSGVDELGSVRVTDLRRFLADESLRRPAASSQARTVAALKCFFRFCVESEYLERDPAAVLRTPKKREALPDVLDRHELGRLLAVPDREGVWQREHRGKRERDRLLLALFAYAGLRRSELLGLDWDDVDLQRRLLRVRVAKGGRQRVVPIHPALGPLFADYLSTRCGDSEPALFVGVHGRRLSQTILSETFRRYARAGRRHAAQARHAAHAASRVRLRAAARRGEPAPDPGPARPQAPGLHTALHPRHGARAARRDQATALADGSAAMRLIAKPLT